MPTSIAAEVCNRCLASGTTIVLVLGLNFTIMLIDASGLHCCTIKKV
jgi:hypothetical protein